MVGSDMSLIETDIAMQKLRDVYEDLNSLKSNYANEPQPLVQKTSGEDDDLPDIEVQILTGDDAPSGEIIIEDAPVKETKKQESEMKFVEPVVQPVVEKKEVIDSFELDEEPFLPEVKKKVHVEKEPEQIKTTEKPAVEKAQSKTVADQYETKKSLNDFAAINNKVKDLASKIKDQPIKDLKEAINLNERFLFTRDLFGGNAEKYGKTIDELNRVNDLDEAMAYLNNNFTWDMEKDSFKKFLELVYRRHIPVK